MTVTGLGNMGSALARALLDAPQGYSVTVRNHSSEKAAPLVEKGAVLALHICAALTGRRIILICVTNYAAANHILGEAVCQLKSDMPHDAENPVFPLGHGLLYS